MKLRYLLWIYLSPVVLGFLYSSIGEAASSCATSGYRVGAAQDDITGPIAELGMMGYADIGQLDQGLHMRLRSRTLVISNGCGEETMAMVIADIAMVFHGLKQSILERLNQQLPGVFSHKNLLLSATHTHAGPGGFAHHALYNITTIGFSPTNFEAIVAGTVRSILKAYRQQEAAQLQVVRGELNGIQYNRSPTAYEANAASEKARFASNTDPEMLMLKASSLDGKALAAFNWFAVHGVSLPMDNKLVSGDNKGLAAYKFEKKMGASYLKDGEFIAGFVQANSGDISPYDVSRPIPKGTDGYPRNEQSAQAQFDKAFELFGQAEEVVAGPLAAVHSFVDLAHYPIDGEFTGQGPQTTCQAALGFSFAAGTENGQPIDLFKEGTIYGSNWPKITLLPQEQACHAEKVILLPTGLVKPDPWTARIAPFQLMRIGQLLVIAAPFEITTMAGRRLKQAILETMAPAGVKYVAIAALANEYIHYVTTREEYAQQAYEGGSTLFGPWSLAAFTEIYSGLGSAMREGRAVDAGALPADLAKKQLVLKPGVIFDATPNGKDFGDVKDDALESYQAGDRIEVRFWGAHPNNSMEGRDRTLLMVEQWQAGRWQTVRHDWDPDTFYHWQREGLANSIVTVSWFSEQDTPAGVYRICQQGHSKEVFTGAFKPYRGCSKSFALTE